MSYHFEIMSGAIATDSSPHCYCYCVAVIVIGGGYGDGGVAA